MNLFDQYSVLKASLSKKRCEDLLLNRGHWQDKKFIFDQAFIIEVHGIKMKVLEKDYLV